MAWGRSVPESTQTAQNGLASPRVDGSPLDPQDPCYSASRPVGRTHAAYHTTTPVTAVPD